jgi:hypothetical protein
MWGVRERGGRWWDGWGGAQDGGEENVYLSFDNFKSRTEWERISGGPRITK